MASIDRPTWGNMAWKAPVSTAANLPLTNNTAGDARTAQDTGVVYVWNGSAWIVPPTGAPTFPAVLSVTGNLTMNATTNKLQTLNVNTSTAAANITLSLPSPSLCGSGWYCYIHDVGGAMSTYQIILARFGSEKIENVAANMTLYTDYGYWVLYTDGTNWFLG